MSQPKRRRRESISIKITPQDKRYSKDFRLIHLRNTYPLVHIVIKAAKNLPGRGKHKTCNPGIILTCGVLDDERVLKSSIKKSVVKDVEFDEEFEFLLKTNEDKKVTDSLRIEVRDYRPLSSNFMGICFIDLHKLPKNKTKEHTVPLLGVESGELIMDITAYNFGIDEETIKDSNNQTKNENPGILPQLEEGENKKLERYEKLDRIGQGSFGSVFKAKDTKNGRIVAIKRVNCKSLDEINDSLKEIVILTTLSHSGLIKYHDLYLELINDCFGVCFVMDLFELGDLNNYLKRKKGMKKYLSKEKIVDYARQIANALEYLHSKKIIHRDLKPQNIFMCDKYKTLKIGDFGLSKALDKTFTSTIVGSLSYMSPEVNQGRHNYKADIWAFGVILYELITLDLGHTHYAKIIKEGDKHYEYIKNEINSKNPECANLFDLIKQCLSVELNDRPSASEILKMLN